MNIKKTIQLFESGSIRNYNISDNVISACKSLAAGYENYFTLDSFPEVVKLEKLILTRAREDGIANAVTYMEKASKGEIAKRAPVLVKPYNRDYLVLDGNSTVIILNAIDCTEVPVLFSSEDQ